MKGYHGVILDINLTNGKIKKEILKEDAFANFLGGRGLGIKILYESIKPGTNPLSEENLLMIFPGLLTGQRIPSASRTTIITKSPHTTPANKKYKYSSTLTYSNFGGFFGPELKFAGYDGLIIRGKSPSPVYIYIKDENVEIRDAKRFWGMGSDHLDKQLRKELKDERFQAIYIGPAGENLVEYASIIHTSSRASGRGGVGAVMGSKKLKAIVVKGTGKAPDIKAPEKLYKLVEFYSKKFETSKRTLQMRRYGTAGALKYSSNRGSQAVKNYREGTFKYISKIDGFASEKQVWRKDYACFMCPLSCKKAGIIKEGKYKGFSHDGPEYETGTMLGANLLVSDLGGLLKEIYLADDYGLDAISTGNTIGFLMEAYEKGLINKKFLSGIDLKWGNVDAIIKILELIAYKKGVGVYAGKGVKYLSEMLGKNSSQFSIHVKGNELAAWNVHVSIPTGISYATANRGACHLNGGSVFSQNRHAIVDSLGICFFAGSFYGKTGLLEILNALTGFDLTYNDYMKIGERIFNLERMFNVREGFSSIDDRLPERFFTEPLSYGPKKGSVLSKEKFYSRLKKYYKERGWDLNSGIPEKQKLNELGLL